MAPQGVQHLNYFVEVDSAISIPYDAITIAESIINKRTSINS